MTDWKAPGVLLALLLAACSQGSPADGEPEVSADNIISCAIGTASELTPNCSVERAVEGGALFLTIWHEDGGFRRLRVMTDGSGVMAADGADNAQIAVFDGEIEVKLGGDRYILPATITGNAAE